MFKIFFFIFGTLVPPYNYVYCVKAINLKYVKRMFDKKKLSKKKFFFKEKKFFFGSHFFGKNCFCLLSFDTIAPSVVYLRLLNKLKKKKKILKKKNIFFKEEEGKKYFFG